MNRGLAFFMLLLTLGLGIVDIAINYPALPDTIASHFDVSGHADGWISKSGFVAVYVGILALLTGVFIGLPFLISRIPDSLINMPNKAYWLAPERRTTTLDGFSRQFYWYGMVAGLFVVLTIHQVIRFNLGESSALGKSFRYLLILFLLFTIFWSLNLYLKFRNAPTHVRFDN